MDQDDYLNCHKNHEVGCDGTNPIIGYIYDGGFFDF